MTVTTIASETEDNTQFYVPYVSFKQFKFFSSYHKQLYLTHNVTDCLFPNGWHSFSEIFKCFSYGDISVIIGADLSW